MGGTTTSSLVFFFLGVGCTGLALGGPASGGVTFGRCVIVEDLCRPCMTIGSPAEGSVFLLRSGCPSSRSELRRDVVADVSVAFDKLDCRRAAWGEVTGEALVEGASDMAPDARRFADLRTDSSDGARCE